MKTMLNALNENSVARFELDKAKTAIEQFVYSCSHTLRAPLKSISGLVYLLKNTGNIPMANPDEYLRSIELTVTKMESLLNELEQFLTNSRNEIVADAISLDTLVETVIGDFKDQIHTAKIKVKTTIDQPMAFYSDGSRFRMVLSHLVANAITFHQPGSRNKRIGVKISVSEGVCRLSVRDNGIGIRNEMLPRICDLFFRGSEHAAGAGVGLYVVNEIVKKMGGQLSIKSVIGRGTQVVVTFPNLTL